MGAVPERTAGRTLRKGLHYLFTAQFTRFLTAACERMPWWAFRRYGARVLRRSISSSDAILDISVEEYKHHSIREVVREDLPVCAALAGVPVVEFYRRFDHGDRCIAMFHGQQPVHIEWLHYGSCYIRGLNLLVQLDDTECYIYDVLTDPMHQGKHLAALTHRRILGVLAAGATTQVVVIVMENHPAPFRLFTRLGYDCVQVVRHVTICGIRNTVITDRSHGSIVSQFRYRRPLGVFWI